MNLDWEKMISLQVGMVPLYKEKETLHKELTMTTIIQTERMKTVIRRYQMSVEQCIVQMDKRTNKLGQTEKKTVSQTKNSLPQNHVIGWHKKKMI